MFCVTVGVARQRTLFFDVHGDFIDWFDWVACRQYFRHIRAGRGWDIQVKYYVRRPMVNFLVKVKKPSRDKSKLYILPDFRKCVKNLHAFIIHSLYISANIADIV